MATGTFTGVSATGFSDVKFLPKIRLENDDAVNFQAHHIIPSSALMDKEFMEALTGPNANVWDNDSLDLISGSRTLSGQGICAYV
ncbi:MAG: hypothetical protein P1V21_25990 [Rhizobiaceae bacterium]|nr:hypothetical protein [Rhizobiaceae bacterium]